MQNITSEILPTIMRMKIKAMMMKENLKISMKSAIKI